MAREQTEDRKTSSLEDIAATLYGKKPSDATESDDAEAEEAVVVSEDTAEYDDDQSPDEGLDDEGSEDVSLEDDTETDEEQTSEDDDEDASAEEQLEFLDIRDDDIIPVMVDGEEVEATIGELKKALSGEGAIEKRLKEATELRKTAHAERTMYLERLAEEERALQETFGVFDDNLYKAMIPPPDSSLKQSDPQRYLRHQEAYEADQKRIKEAKDAVDKARQEVAQRRAGRLQQYAQVAADVIRKEIPELMDPQTSDKMFRRMADTAKTYGYTDQEIQNALDPRVFMLVRDAMKYRQSLEGGKDGDKMDDFKTKQKRKARRLRSGNTTAKTKARAMDSKRKKITERARKTGKVDDIAATLLQPKG